MHPRFKPFGEFTGLVPVPHWSKFFIVDNETGIKLNGMPDDIFIMEDGKYFIVDYKTTKNTGNQDALLPLCSLQLNGYVFIFGRLSHSSSTHIHTMFAQIKLPSEPITILIVLHPYGSPV